MGKVIIRNAVKREEGFLYYVDGEGNICKAHLIRRKGKKK